MFPAELCEAAPKIEDPLDWGCVDPKEKREGWPVEELEEVSAAPPNMLPLDVCATAAPPNMLPLLLL